MLKEGALPAVALCRHVLPARESMSPVCLCRWRSESSNMSRVELLCSDPADLAVAIAMHAMFLEPNYKSFIDHCFGNLEHRSVFLKA